MHTTSDRGPQASFPATALRSTTQPSGAAAPGLGGCNTPQSNGTLAGYRMSLKVGRSGVPAARATGRPGLRTVLTQSDGSQLVQTPGGHRHDGALPLRGSRRATRQRLKRRPGALPRPVHAARAAVCDPMLRADRRLRGRAASAVRAGGVGRRWRSGRSRARHRALYRRRERPVRARHARGQRSPPAVPGRLRLGTGADLCRPRWHAVDPFADRCQPRPPSACWAATSSCARAANSTCARPPTALGFASAIAIPCRLSSNLYGYLLVGSSTRRRSSASRACGSIAPCCGCSPSRCSTGCESMPMAA